MTVFKMSSGHSTSHRPLSKKQHKCTLCVLVVTLFHTLNEQIAGGLSLQQNFEYRAIRNTLLTEIPKSQTNGYL